MKKHIGEIVVGVIVALSATVIIVLIVTCKEVLKNEVVKEVEKELRGSLERYIEEEVTDKVSKKVEETQNRLTSSLHRYIEEEVTDKVNKETDKISGELKNERTSRCELALVLAKSGMDIPTHLIVKFSSVNVDPEMRPFFLAGLSKNLTELRMKKQYKQYVQDMTACEATYPLAARLKEGAAILAFCRSRPEAEFAPASEETIKLVLKEDDGTDLELSKAVGCYKSAIELLSVPGIKLNAVRRVGIREPIKKPPPKQDIDTGPK